jgi:hypothetical protein
MKKYIITILISVILSVFIMGQLQYPLDPQDQSILRDFLSKNIDDVIFNSVWDSFFHYSTIFEGYADGTDIGQGGLDTFISAGAVAGINPDGIILSTGNTNNNLAQIYKYPEPTLGASTVMPFLSWKNESRFRTNIAVSSVANQTGYIVAGLDPTANSLPFYGFKIVNGNLYGVSRKDASVETTTLLQAISVDTSYLVEARHNPLIHKVEFFIEVSGKMVLKGSINTLGSIPDVGSTNHNGLFFYSMQTNTTADKQLVSSYFEYIQKRDK